MNPLDSVAGVIVVGLLAYLDAPLFANQDQIAVSV